RHTRSKRDWSSDVCSSDLKKSSPNVGGVSWTGGVAAIRKSPRSLYLPRRPMAETAGPLVVIRTRPAKFDGSNSRPGISFTNTDRSEERRVGKECRWWWAGE